MCDALQLQRCVVYCVLDSSGVIWVRTISTTILALSAGVQGKMCFAARHATHYSPLAYKGCGTCSVTTPRILNASTYHYLPPHAVQDWQMFHAERRRLPRQVSMPLQHTCSRPPAFCPQQNQVPYTWRMQGRLNITNPPPATLLEEPHAASGMHKILRLHGDRAHATTSYRLPSFSHAPLPTSLAPHSILWHAHLIDPAVSWLLQRYAVPVYSPAAVEAWQRLLRVVLQVTWLLPLYVISLIVSCIW